MNVKAHPKSCTYCGGRSFYHRRYSGEVLCRKHFAKTVEKRVYRRVKDFLVEKSRVGLAISGGKDSLVMAHIVSGLRDKLFEVELVGLIVDEGIEGYRIPSIEKALKAIRKLDLKHRVVSMKERFSTVLDEVISSTDRNPCTLCGVLRRRALSLLAEEEDVDMIFTGHNADDMAQTVIMNLALGNVKGLTEGHRLEGETAREKPLKDIPEREVVLYALVKGIDYYSDPCPYTNLAFRNDVRNFISHLEYRHAGSIYSIIRSAEKLRGRIKEIPVTGRCRNCGRPTTRSVCKVCEILEEVRRRKDGTRSEM